MRLLFAVTVLAFSAHAQEFSVASVKASARVVGKDYRKPIAVGEDRVSGRNASLKDLLVEAYGMEPFRISGPGWIDENEYDVEGRAEGPVTREQLRAMLQRLLTERFKIASHREEKEIRVHALVVDKGGAKLRPGSGDLRQLARLISIQLTIPTIQDPTRPSIASGAPAPVIDKTGLTGKYDLPEGVTPEAAADMFELWQRTLKELGLRLETQRAGVTFLVVDRAEKAPVAN
jgi:uncharacterized protein (TIGR03435 family)